ncbi:MAG: hypothetical protein Kow0069_39340 [Promethearchaeota archaeon]
MSEGTDSDLRAYAAELKPYDVLLLGSYSSFNVTGGRIGTSDEGWPSTFAGVAKGAVLKRALAERGMGFHDLDELRRNGREPPEALREALEAVGHGGAEPKVALRGMAYVDYAHLDAGELLLPAPADAFHWDSGGNPGGNPPHDEGAIGALSPAGCGWGENLVEFLFTNAKVSWGRPTCLAFPGNASDCETVAEKFPKRSFISSSALGGYLLDGKLEESDLRERPFERDHRVQVKLAQSKVVDEDDGMFYVRYLGLKPRVGYSLLLSGPAGLVDPLAGGRGTHACPVGGLRRGARASFRKGVAGGWAKLLDAQRDALERVNDVPGPKALKAYFVTPVAVDVEGLDGRWLKALVGEVSDPEDHPLDGSRLAGAFGSKPKVLGGWDHAHHQPKPRTYCHPAGTVVHFRVEGGKVRVPGRSDDGLPVGLPFQHPGPAGRGAVARPCDGFGTFFLGLSVRSKGTRKQRKRSEK